MQYWRCLPYLGFGAGAHGYANYMRVANVLKPSEYIHRILNYDRYNRINFPQSPGTIETNVIDQKTEMSETMIMGMRLILEGISTIAFYKRFGLGLEQVYGDEIDKLRKWGLVEWSSDNPDILRLTNKGCLLGNRVFSEFL
jgi:oxygen-independent coproporphyrinogen-3 oxidase